MGRHRLLLASFGRGSVLLLALALLGCYGRPTATVIGCVTYKGQLVTTGSITFLRADGRTASGRIRSDGTYTIYRAPVGRVMILVDSRTQSSHGAEGPTGESATLNGPGADEVEGVDVLRPFSRAEPIPARYSRSDQSGLEYSVRRGEQTYDIVLVP